MISVNVENVQELMVAADMLQLNEVVSVCGEFLKGHMDPSNCVGIFQFLEQIACVDMLEFTENYIHVHFLEVCNGLFKVAAVCVHTKCTRFFPTVISTLKTAVPNCVPVGVCYR